MQLEDYFDFQAPNDIRIKDHRIGIESILREYIFHERTAEEIAEEFDTISLEQVYATILYYLHNKTTIHQYMTDWLEYGRKAREEDQRKHPEFYERLRKFTAEREQQLQRPA